MIEIDEKQCIKKAAQGDATAFEELLVRYQGQVYNLCLRMTANAEDAADLTQEAFVKVWKNLDTFQFDAAFSTWLYRLASNCCLDFLRSRKRRPTVSLTMETDEEDEQTAELPDDSPTPEEAAIVREERETLYLAMQSIDDEQRQILTLRVVNDLSYSDIARVLGIREGTVKSRLSRARESLRKKLTEIGNKRPSRPSKR